MHKRGDAFWSQWVNFIVLGTKIVIKCKLSSFTCANWELALFGLNRPNSISLYSDMMLWHLDLSIWFGQYKWFPRSFAYYALTNKLKLAPVYLSNLRQISKLLSSIDTIQIVAMCIFTNYFFKITPTEGAVVPVTKRSSTCKEFLLDENRKQEKF